jgi:RNA polymerase sigma-70 factor (ECF subfamily)
MRELAPDALAMVSDAALIRGIVERDPAAAGLLFDRHADRLLSFIARRIDGAESEDVLQEVFVRVLQRASSFRGDSSVRTWLCGIARLVIHERLRGARRHALATPLDRAGSKPGPESLALRTERNARLVAALQRLPDDQAIVLELHHVDGLAHEEIALRLGISSAASRKRLQRATRALCAHLNERSRSARHARLESWRDSLLRRVSAVAGRLP